LSDIYQRKRDHIALCDTGDVEAGDHRGLFAEVRLVHQAMPELAMGELDLTTRLLDHELKAPLMVTGMTGGPEEAGRINRGIAKVCGELGLAFGVGSQRIATREAAAQGSFEVREVAPDVVLFANLGINQVRDLGVDTAAELMRSIDADYLAIHLNPAMELVQPGADADRDFRSGYETVARAVDALDGRVLVKECGTGISPDVVRRLHALGVRAVDVSGSGGTSWVKVEALRAKGALADLGMLFADWGIPTAAAVAMAADVGPQVVASGGVGDGLVAAKALALGADIAGCARPVLQAFQANGEAGARAFLESMLLALRTAMALTGCRRPAELRDVPRVLGPRLTAWLQQLD
jgi:isopentenyl-diphosphate delta-isomerase